MSHILLLFSKVKTNFLTHKSALLSAAQCLYLYINPLALNESLAKKAP
jgi:hypothetical protein